MTENGFPISQPYELGRLSQAGDEVIVAASPDDLGRIARWADVVAVDTFRARIDLRKISPTRFAIEAELEADIVQNCVVSLEPVRSRIERHFTRELFLSQPVQQAGRAIDVDLAAADDDGREEIGSLRYDLAIPVLEEFALAIDPYPRAANAAFEPPQDETDSAKHPFAALKSLKNRS
jgi:hypothetical protein